MPIRFRCAYCNQLMGIARRKAGAVVRCPSCASQVTVPQPQNQGAMKGGKDPAAPIFERSDFDELFNPGGMRPRPGTPLPDHGADPGPALSPPPVDFLRKPEPAPVMRASFEHPGEHPEATLAGRQPPSGEPGFLVTRKLARLLTIGAIVALLLAFAAGVALGMMMQRPNKEEAGLKRDPERAQPLIDSLI